MQVGYGKARITPPLGTPCALGLEDELVAVFDDLFVRAVWLQVEEQGALILAADIIGLDLGDSDEFIAHVASETSVAPDRIILHATHTHQTACTHWEVAQPLEAYGLADQHSSPEFKALLGGGFVRAARQAMANAAESRMAYLEVPVVGIASNRRVPLEGQSDKVIFRESRPSAELRARPEGMIDPLLRMVPFQAVDDGRLVGICNYNCHPTAGGGDEGPYATGDFPGMGMTLAEWESEQLQLLHLTGTCGEINPGKHVSSDSYAPEARKKDIERLGRRYADAILSAVHSAGDWQSPASLAVASQAALELPVSDDLPGEADLLAQLEDEVVAYRKAKPAGAATRGPFRRPLSRYSVRRHTHNSNLALRAAALRVGDVYFSFMPGEIFLQFGNTLREHLGNSRLLNATLCFGQNFGYLVPPESFAQGGYEPTATVLAPQAYDRFMEAMQALLKQVSA
jgi:hypothetical protein